MCSKNCDEEFARESSSWCKSSKFLNKIENLNFALCLPSCGHFAHFRYYGEIMLLFVILNPYFFYVSSGIAVSSGSSTSSRNGDITDPGSPFSTSSDDSSPAKSSYSPDDPGSPIMAPCVSDFHAGLPAAAAICSKPILAARSPLFPPCRTLRAQRSTETRVKRRLVRRPSPADTQGKITEYFKSQSKPMVGIKRDFNYLKKESFSKETLSFAVTKKSRDTVVKTPEEDASKLPFELTRQRSTAKTLFNKILHNHKQRKLVENFLKTRAESKVSFLLFSVVWFQQNWLFF